MSRNYRRPNYRGLVLCTASVFTLMGTTAKAAAVLEEVIVTAQKREENLQETPISLDALNAQTLEERGITNVWDLGNVVPALHIMPFDTDPNSLNVYIRGVGIVDVQVTGDSPVGVYLNGVYIARTSTLGVDQAGLERIEVLRGPQGTLYGRNTTGGAVNIITAKPDDKFGGSQLLSFGNYGAVRTETVLNLPVTDTFYVRGTFQWDKRNGWVKNTSTGPAAGRDFSEYDNLSSRLDMRWKPSDVLTVDYSFDWSHSDNTSDYLQVTEATPGFAFLQRPHRVTSAALPNPFQGNNDLAWGHTLTVSLETGIGEFKSISAYRETHSYEYEDFSGNPIIAVYRNDPNIVNQHQISQEFQLVGSNNAKTLDYIAGLYYFDENATQADRDVVDIAGPGVYTFYNATAINSTYAVYGQLTWRPDADSPWSATLGGRYTKDKRTAGNGSTANGASPIPFVSDSYDNFSPSLIVNYRFADDNNVYGKIVSGYKAGGFDLRAASSLLSFAHHYDPEKIVNYELGWKTEWLQHRLRWNNALFYMNYKDIQLEIPVPNQPNPSLTETANAGKAKVAGMETDLAVTVTDALRLQLSYAYLYNKILQVQIPGENINLWHLTAAPKTTVDATGDWDIVRLPFGTLNATVDYSWRSDSYTTSRDYNIGPIVTNGGTVPAYSLTDLRLSLTGDDWVGHGTNCRVSLWVRNLTDTQYKLDPAGTFATVHAVQFSNFGTPRTYGIDFKVKY